MANEGGNINSALPEWLTAPEPASGEKTGGVSAKNKKSILERTLHETVRFLDDALFNETVSAKNGFLQKVDARIKIAAILALIVALSFKRGPMAMLPFALFALLLAAASRVPMGVFIKRLLPPVLMTSVIALPAAFNFVVGGREVFAFSLFHTGGRFWLPPEIYLTRQGLLSALGLVIRVLASLELVFLISFTTRPARLIKGLGSMLPGFARTVAGITYRYIFFLVRKLEDFSFAYKARTSSRASVRQTRQWTGSRAAALLLISLELKDSLKMAMEARGMSYALRDTEGPLRPGAADILFLALCGGFLLI